MYWNFPVLTLQVNIRSAGTANGTEPYVDGTGLHGTLKYQTKTGQFANTKKGHLLCNTPSIGGDLSADILKNVQCAVWPRHKGYYYAYLWFDAYTKPDAFYALVAIVGGSSAYL